MLCAQKVNKMLKKQELCFPNGQLNSILRPNGNQNNVTFSEKAHFKTLISFFKFTLRKFERTNFRLIIILYSSDVCFLKCIKTFCTGQLDELYPKNGLLLPDQATIT